MSAPMAERVAAGIAWLDENYSGWRERVNVDEISFPSTLHCPLGQLGIFGNDHCPDLEGLGFNVTQEETKQSRDGGCFEELAVEWKRQLRGEA